MQLRSRVLRFMLMVVAAVGINCFEALATAPVARLSGEIEGAQSGAVRVHYGDFERVFEVIEVNCNEGCFEVAVPIDRLSEVELSSGGEVLARVLIAPEQTLHIEQRDGEIAFTGSAGEINTTLHNYLRKMRFESFTPSFTLPSAEQFLEVIDRNIEIERGRMERELSGAPQSLRRWAEVEIRYRNSCYAVEYARRNRLSDSASLAELYDRDRFPIDTTGAITLDYFGYLGGVVHDCYLDNDPKVARLRVQRDFAGAYVAAIERVAQVEQHPEERDMISAMILRQAYDGRNQLFEQVLELIHDRQIVGDQLIARLDRMRRDRADMRRFTAHTFDRLLAESHHEVIYVDTWATWCPPCQREMKHLRRMEKRLENEPIRFVSLCVSSPYAQWALTVDLPDNRSANYWLDDEAQAVLDRYIRIRSFPRFFVLSGGRIINENVQWPSSNDLIDGILRGYVEELRGAPTTE